MQLESMSEFIDWALEQNIETQVLLANRSMLRCLPAITRTKEKDVILSGFRAGLTSWVGIFSTIPLNISVKYLAARSHVEPYSSQNALLAAREAAIATYGQKGYLRPRNAELSLADSIDALVHLESEYSSSESGIVIASNKFKNKHQLDLIALSELEFDFNSYIENGLKYMWTQPLWQQSILQPIGVRQSVLEFVTHHDPTNNSWKFWIEWYQGILDGEPLDWNLQREVALIPDADWDKGPAHIASLINPIWERYKLKERIKELEALLPKDKKARHGIGGNNPPPEFEDITSPEQFISISYAAIDVLKGEIEETEPDKTLLQWAINALGHVLKAIGKYGSILTGVFITAGVAAAGAKYGEDVVKSVIEHTTNWYNHLP